MDELNVTSTVCTITPMILEPKTPNEINLRLSFVETFEFHKKGCRNIFSPYPEDHIVAVKKPLRIDYIGSVFSFPLVSKLLPYCMECAEVPDEAPAYVTSCVWSYVKSTLLEYLLKTVDFNDQSGFEMVAEVQVSEIVHLIIDDCDAESDITAADETYYADQDDDEEDDDDYDCGDEDLYDYIKYGCGASASTDLMSRFLGDSMMSALATIDSVH